MSKPLSIFISYSHRDEHLKEELEKHLSPLVTQGKIKLWQDRAIEAGTEWGSVIKAQLEEAQIILLLVTPRFMASDYISDIELVRALERHESGLARVIPILLRPTDISGSLISNLQFLPKDAKPVTIWADRDQAFTNIVESIKQVVESWRSEDISSTFQSTLYSASPKSSIEAERTSIRQRQRLHLFQILSELPSQQFQQLVFALKPPTGFIPPSSASSSSRAAALLEWAESPLGIGLEEVEKRLP